MLISSTCESNLVTLTITVTRFRASVAYTLLYYTRLTRVTVARLRVVTAITASLQEAIVRTPDTGGNFRSLGGSSPPPKKKMPG